MVPESALKNRLVLGIKQSTTVFEIYVQDSSVIETYNMYQIPFSNTNSLDIKIVSSLLKLPLDI